MKLTHIITKNFQSHALTEVGLSPGINAFIGASDQGKTATLRGLSWLVNNSPSGDAIVSDWARNEKGELTDECSVTVDTDSGVRIRRIKTAKRNGYDVGKDVFNAIKTNVPPQVEDALNLGPVNWQRQLDPPFLLSDSGGARARFFNQLIRLEEVDQCMSMAESLRRKVSGAIPPLEEGIAAGKARLSELGWVDTQETNLKLLEELLQENEQACVKLAKLQLLVEELQEAQASVLRLAPPLKQLECGIDSLRIEYGILVVSSRTLNALAPIRARLQDAEASLLKTDHWYLLDASLDSIRTDSQELLQEQDRFVRLRRLSTQLQVAQATLGSTPVDLDVRLSFLQKLVDRANETTNKKTNLGIVLTKLYVTTRDLGTYDTQLAELETQIPDVCPLCSGKGSLKEHAHG